LPRLLIIDDDEALRRLLRSRLETSYEITDTSDPEEGIALALQKKPDAILLDLMMPRYSGFEVCQTLSSLSFTQLIPIFIVSGESSERYKDFCQNLGARGFFQKPVDFEKLREALARAIDGNRYSTRSEARVRIKAALRLRGRDSAGEPFELFTATDNVTANGFLCGCRANIKESAVVEVYLETNGQQFSGKAHAVRVDWPGTPRQTCEFQFVEKPADWVL
jgi:DNA-binding response OmpR family regulator